MQASSIAEQLFFTTVRIETRLAAGMIGTGTSFIFRHEIAGQQYLFLVTNKHIVKGAQSGRLTFIQGKDGKPIMGTAFTVDVDDFEKQWYGHPNSDVDVAVIPLVPILDAISKQGASVFYRAIPSTIVPSDDAIGKLDALEEVVFIGYPSGIWDTKNLLPIMRKGTTATPIAVDFQGTKTFLIDASVFPGSSGSPVFLYNAGAYHQRDGSIVVGSRLMFLGLVAKVFYRQEMNEIKVIPSPTADVSVAESKEMIDLGIVFKAATIRETIEAFLKDHRITKN